MDGRGIWRLTQEHHFDEKLAEFLKNFFPKPNTILDLGCGWQKKYVIYLDADGYDGNPNTLDGDVLDLSEPFDLGKKYDAVLCLEVIEHIPPEYEQTVLDNICKHAKTYIVLSWARPGQQGHGHVNCRSREYVIEQMKQRGFTVLWAVGEKLRTACELPWFRKNTLIFRIDQK